MKTFLMWFFGIVIILIVSYVLFSVWSSCKGPDININIPKVEKATHSFHIENTGGMVLSSDFEQIGTEVGKRVFILKEYWEMRGNKFELVKSVTILSEKDFGEITVKRR